MPQKIGSKATIFQGQKILLALLGGKTFMG